MLNQPRSARNTMCPVLFQAVQLCLEVQVAEEMATHHQMIRICTKAPCGVLYLCGVQDMS